MREHLATHVTIDTLNVSIVTSRGAPTQFIKTTHVNASAERVWDVFAHGFDHAYLWMAAVRHSYGKENGAWFEGVKSAGRVCELRPGPTGRKATERFLKCDEAARTCAVRIEFLDAPAMFPVHYNEIDLSVVDTGEEQSSITWVFRSKIKVLGYVMWPALRVGSTTFVQQIAQELAHYAETGEPHPRKLAAQQKARLLENV